MNTYALRLTDNINTLYEDLTQGTYTHGTYDEYTIHDPKKRVIHKASIRDRIVHRLLYNALNKYFDTKFIHDSYSCRIGKGTHKARDRFRTFANQVSRNYSKPCYVLKFDIKKCFESVDHTLLKILLKKHIADTKIYQLLETIIESFCDGLPLGNLTSQLFINIYLHELDHYVKHALKEKHYIRYADDFVLLARNRNHLPKTFRLIERFLGDILKLTLHKVEVRSIYAGVDVLGEVFFARYMRLRRSTERRAQRRLKIVF